MMSILCVINMTHCKGNKLFVTRIISLKFFPFHPSLPLKDFTAYPVVSSLAIREVPLCI